MIWLLSLLLVPSAHARDWSCGDYTGADFDAALDAIDGFIAEYDGAKAKRRLAETSKDLPCMTDPVRPGQLSRFATQASLLGFFEQDSVQTERWGKLARSTSDDPPWPDFVAPDHPFREEVDALDLTPTPKDAFIAWPKKQSVLFDGRLLTEASALVEVPHLVQVADKKGIVVDAWWQDGLRFRDSLLADSEQKLKTPKWWDAWVEMGPEQPGGDAVAAVDPPPPPKDDGPPPPKDDGPPPPKDDGPPPPKDDGPDVADASDGRPDRPRRKPRPEDPPIVFDYAAGLSDCPWIGDSFESRDLEVEVDGNDAVIVDGVRYPVVMQRDWSAFARMLENDCGSPRAARQVRIWRAGPGEVVRSLKSLATQMSGELGGVAVEAAGTGVQNVIARRKMVVAIKETAKFPEYAEFDGESEE